MSKRISVLAVLAVLAAAATATAQSVIVPAVAVGADGNSSTSFPFDTATVHAQYIYDSSNFTSQGVLTPIVITGIKVRANQTATATTTTSWTGGTSTLQLDLSTAPIDYSAITTTFASNHGADQTTVFNGTLTTLPGSTTVGVPGPFHVDVVLGTPFLYDPNAGDLTIDWISSGIVIANMPTCDAVTTAGAALARRVTTTSLTALTGTLTAGELANVLEISYLPAAGLFAAFQADTTSGLSPLTVNFTDSSFTSAPGGIQTWAWDLDGNGTIDSTLQHPSFNYAACGDYDVTLTVTDGVNPQDSRTRTGYIHVDDVTLTPTFTVTPLGPNVMQFTDTTTPTPTTVEWDFTGDGIADAFGASVAWVFAAPCTAADVMERVTYGCRGPFAATRGIVVGARTADVSPSFDLGTQASPWVGVFLDIAVTNPTGLSVCALTVNTYAFSGPYSARVYLTPGSYVGKDTQIDQWRLIGEGSGTATAVGTTGAPNTSIAAMNAPFFLPPGNFGMAVYIGQPSGNAGISYSTASQGTTGNTDISFYPDPVGAPGISRTGLFAGGSFGPPRVWNGELHYTTCDQDSTPGYGFFGPGCPGTLPTATNIATAVPRLGQNMVVQFDNVPFAAGLMLLGFSNTLSPTVGPLPLDVSPFGMTGCALRVDPALNFFYLGAGTQVTGSVFVPNSTQFLCLKLYTQMFVFDTGANPFGGVLSDAATAVIGQ